MYIVIKHDGFRKSSPPVMTPPRRTVAGTGLGIELSRTIKAIMPQLSADSGLVTSMGDTLEHPQVKVFVFVETRYTG